MVSAERMTKRNTLQTQILLTSVGPDCLKNRPGVRRLGMMGFSETSIWDTWSVSSRNKVSKCQLYKGYSFKHSTPRARSPSISNNILEGAELFAEKQWSGSLEWMWASLHGNKEFKQVLRAGVHGAPFTVLRFLQGLRISKVYSDILQPFHQLGICIPWSYQLDFSSESPPMTVAPVTDCYLLVIPALLPPTWAVPFWCKYAPGLAWLALCAADVSN